MKSQLPRSSRLRLRQPRGYSLMMTIVLLAILASSIAALTSVILSSGKTTSEMITRRKAFYVCDGMSRILTKLSSDYLATAVSPTSADIEAYLCQVTGNACPALPNVTPADYTVDSFAITVDDVTTAPVPSGPFQGMLARQTTVRMSTRVSKNGTGYACEQSQQVTLAQIGLFQFFVFAEDYVDIFNGPDMTIDGRVHVNGDFCGSTYGASNTLRIETVTASGDILVAGNCPRFEPGSPGGELFVKERGTSNWVSMRPDNDHTCTICSPLSWADYADARWQGNVQDSDHQVPVLKVPVEGTPPVQDGRNASGVVANNADTQRFIVDPIQSSDTDSTREQRLAYKADIRIINGVWYKADPSYREGWPGTPIWSDHPGAFTATNQEGIEGTEEVGQAQITTARGYTTLPNRYSYYEYNTTNNRLDNNNDGVISYGSLFRAATVPPTWRPGFMMHHDAEDEVLGDDPDGEDQHRLCSFNNAGLGIDVGDFSMRDAWSQACYACIGGNVDEDCTDFGESRVDLEMAKFVEATRMGFQDKRVQLGSSRAQARILPVNFDVAQFAAAMATTTDGELGSHFSGGADFNGIVYITNTWPNQMRGLGNNGAAPGAMPALWPQHATGGLQDDLTQALHHTNHTSDTDHFADNWANRALPYPLCSGTGTGGLGYDTSPTTRVGLTGPAEGGDAGFEPYFTIPNCDETDQVLARPNAVRVINAYTINPTVFPRGLTIATNLPAYVLGDTNRNSTDTPADWRPMLVAADSTTFLSSAWDDEYAHWNRDIPTNGSPIPTSTHYRLAVLAGDVASSTTAWSGGINNFPRFNEDWSARTTTIYGSFVIGFRSAFQIQPLDLASYEAPIRDWFYDTNFDTIYNQPPGAPRYNIQAVRRWTAE